MSNPQDPENPIYIPVRENYSERNLEGWRRRPDSTWGDAHCNHPQHDGKDSRPSLSVNLKTGGVKCHGCHFCGTLTEYAISAGLPLQGLPTFEKVAPEPKTRREWVYVTPQGEPVLKVTRLDPGKKIFQNRYENGKWVRGGVQVNPLFNAPALHAAPSGSTVYLVEGEKAAEHLIARGILATTAPEGAGKFHKVGREYLELLLPLGVILIPDNDKPGRQHVASAGKRLRDELAVECKVLLLPGLPEKGDVVDWLQAPRTDADLQKLAAQAHSLDAFLQQVGDGAADPPNADKPNLDEGVLLKGSVTFDHVQTIVAAMRQKNQPLKLFYSPARKLICSLTQAGEVLGVSSPEILANELEGRLGLRFTRVSGNEEEGYKRRPCDPPDKALRRVMSLPPEELGLPVIDEFLSFPVVVTGGELLTQPGLHPSGVFLRPNLELRSFPASPSEQEVSAAVAGLEYLWEEFPFDGLESRQAFWSYVLTPMLASVVPRPFPLFHFSATVQGSGKTLLAKLPGLILQGSPPPVRSLEKKDDAETRKTLTAILSSEGDSGQSGRAGIILDNLSGTWSSPPLEAFLTNPVWSDRILGTNRTGSWQIRQMLAITGNQLKLNDDLGRRQVLIRQTPDTPEPHLRTFKISDLQKHVFEHRALLIQRLCTIVQGWLSAGMPKSSRRLGSFEGWSESLGGILEFAGIGSDFLKGTRVAVSGDACHWQGFIEAWACSYLEKIDQKPSELVRFAREVDIALSEQTPAASLGRKLQQQVDRAFAVRGEAGIRTYQLKLRHSGRNALWSLVETTRNTSETSANGVTKPASQTSVQNTQTSETSTNPDFMGDSDCKSSEDRSVKPAFCRELAVTEGLF